MHLYKRREVSNIVKLQLFEAILSADATLAVKYPYSGGIFMRLEEIPPIGFRQSRAVGCFGGVF